MRIIHIGIDKKALFMMIFGNGLKKVDFVCSTKLGWLSQMLCARK